MDDPQYDLDPYLEGACAHRACGSPTRLKLTGTQFGLRALRTGGAGWGSNSPGSRPPRYFRMPLCVMATRSWLGKCRLRFPETPGHFEEPLRARDRSRPICGDAVTARSSAVPRLHEKLFRLPDYSTSSSRTRCRA